MFASKRTDLAMLFLAFALCLGSCGHQATHPNAHREVGMAVHQTAGLFQYTLRREFPKSEDERGKKPESKRENLPWEHFRLDIGLADGSGAGLDRAGQTYLSFAAQEDFRLVSGGTSIRPGMYRFESDHGIRPVASIYISFPSDGSHADRELVFQNRLDNGQPISFPLNSKTYSETNSLHN